MMRWVALAVGVVLMGAAAIAFPNISDSREGLIAEIVFLLGGGAGFSLVIYGLAARDRRPNRPTSGAERPAVHVRPGSSRDLVVGAAGVVLSAVLLVGLGASGGVGWAALGLLILLPMLAGSVYLCWRSLRPNA